MGSGMTMFQDLAALSHELNEASDNLAEQIAQTEKALNALKLGVSGWVTVAHWTVDGPYPMNWCSQLGYSKHNGKWGLLYIEVSDEIPDDPYCVPLREASREDRLSAIDKFPDLVKELENQARAITADARSKASQLKDTASALRALTQ